MSALGDDGIGAIRVARAGRAVTAILGARVLYLSLKYLTGRPGTLRFHVESATMAFVVVGVLVRLLTSTKPSDATLPEKPHLSTVWLLWSIAMAVALYWPSFAVGMLSDDFVLADRAAHWQVGAVHPGLFRPVPLIIWAIVMHLGAGPSLLHLLNVLIHGTVAFLTMQLAVPVMLSRPKAIASGLLFLVFPASVEAVTWCAGVFDITATLFCVITLLVSRRYEARTRPLRRVLFFACASVALLCKETAAVVPLLVLIDAWALRHMSRQLATDSTVLALIFGAVGVARLSATSSLVMHPITKYIVQRWVFGVFGGLAVPWHTDVMRSFPWIPITGSVVVLGLTAAFLLTRGSIARTGQAIAAGSWPLIGTLPVMTFFFVGPDLQGARYLYLPSVGYAILLATMMSNRQQGGVRIMSYVAATILILCGVVGVRLHQEPWRAAGATRDAVERAAKDDTRMHACRRVAIEGLPDTIRGAFVFRNGVHVAFAHLGLTVVDASAPSCSFQWDQSRLTFVPR